jgi:hypothetical protein
MDQQKLRNLVFEKTGVKVDSNDPIFALVALNEAVLAETVESHLALLDNATTRLLQHAGVPEVQSGVDHRWSPAPDHTSTAPAPFSTHDKHVLAVAGAVGLGAAVLVLAAQALFFRPAPPAPVPVPMAVPAVPALSAEQSVALARADKLARAVQKLDAKSRAMIAAEMKKP